MSNTQTIWKYTLDTVDYQELSMPAGAEILTVQVQNFQPCLWAKVDPHAALEMRGIITHGTGHPVNPEADRYIGTYQISGGSFIFHVFERAAADNANR